MFNWVCWIAPDNTVSAFPLVAVHNTDEPLDCQSSVWVSIMSFLGMVVSPFFPSFRGGLGLSLFTFDWNEIAYIGSP